MHSLSRRHLLVGSGALLSAALLAACGGGAASPTAAPAKPTEAPKPAAEATKPVAAPTAAAASPTAPAKPAAEPTKPAPAATTAAAQPAAKPASGRLMEIDYWHRIGGDGQKMLETLAGEFNTQFEGRIKVTPSNQGSIADLNKKVRAAAAGGGMPGALMGDDYDITQYAFSKIIVPLEPYISSPDHGLTKAQIDDFLPNQLNRHKLAIYDNNTMAFPQGFSAFTTFWNVDALKKAGFDGPPKTWKEFPDHVRAVAKANADKQMSGWLIGGAGDRFISTLLTYNVQWLTEDSKATTFDRPEALEIMTWWRQLGDEKLLAVPKESARDAFVAQRSAYYMDSSGAAVGFYNLIKDFKWDAAMPIQGTAGTAVTETYGPVNALPKTDPEKQAAGWQWLRWLVTPEPHAKYITATSYFPSIKSAGETATLKEFYTKAPIAGKIFKEVAPNARILSPSPALTEVRGQITANVVNEVLLGQLTPEQGVRKLKAEADKAVRNALQG
jgi:sn-glycerol 3-phosphate transport system substrate-binding protein